MRRPAIGACVAALAVTAGGTITGCGTTKVVEKTRTVEVNVAVVKPVDPAFLKDCQPAPLADSTVQAALDRLAATESCVSQLRDQLAQLRAVQP